MREREEGKKRQRAGAKTKSHLSPVSSLEGGGLCDDLPFAGHRCNRLYDAPAALRKPSAPALTPFLLDASTLCPESIAREILGEKGCAGVRVCP